MFIILCILILCILYCVLKTLTLHPTILYILQYTILCILYSVYYIVYIILCIIYYLLCMSPYPHHPHSDSMGVLCFIDQIIRLIGGNAKIWKSNLHLYLIISFIVNASVSTEKCKNIHFQKWVGEVSFIQHLSLLVLPFFCLPVGARP